MSASEIMRQVSEHYDLRTGCRQYHLECQQSFTRYLTMPGYSSFYNNGFDRLQVLDAAHVERIMQQLRSLQNDDRSAWLDPHVETIRFDYRNDAGWIREMYGAVLNVEMDRILVNFFQSEYMVHSLCFHRTFPTQVEDDVSYRWHRDAGPTGHIKIIIYFTGGEISGAGTEALDVNVTYELAEQGYSFPPLNERRSDLGEYFDRANIVYKPYDHCTQAGEALIFRPRDVLHRGVFSRDPQSPRYVATMLLLPSPLHWTQAHELWPLYAQQRFAGKSIDMQHGPVLKGQAKVMVP
ncbi:hypothetical protein O5O45_03595 [Hahella aquimaris]|uniref:hypothetical protein n=1 Tax=Hahella sp. HNIBRBA332 TaxID=3015983 RepID=UPI00273CC1C2|nr:hypothetical protein [Hahella sp. HNIBRBA332]WLQ15013.1 hypothetical protein O5O45_03595 [Hahella sp. HNIBRBA332]